MANGTLCEVMTEQLAGELDAPAAFVTSCALAGVSTDQGRALFTWFWNCTEAEQRSMSTALKTPRGNGS